MAARAMTKRGLMAAVGTSLARPRRGRLIAGVCAGIARRYRWSPWTVRLAFIVSCVLPGPQILIYLALWLLVPAEG